jgi:TonB family protein
MLDRLVPLNPTPAPRVQRAQTQPHRAPPQPAASAHSAAPAHPAAPQKHQAAPAQPAAAAPQQHEAAPAPQHHAAPVPSRPTSSQAHPPAEPKLEAIAAAGTLDQAVELAPESSASSGLVKASEPTPDPFIDWELLPPSDDGNTALTTPVLGGGLTFPSWKRTGVVATSVVGGVGAMAALVFAFQGREAGAIDFTPPAPAVTAPPPPAVTVAPPPAEPTPAPRAEAPAPLEAEPTRAAQSERPPEPETPPAPTFTLPLIPPISESLIVRGTYVPPATVGAPVVRLPSTASAAPAGPTSNQRLQLPTVTNANRVQQALERAYPIGLREVGIGGRVELAFYLNERGTVERYEVRQTSGNAALDQAALRVAPEFEFTPAQRGNTRVAGWFSRGITFGNVVSASAMAEVAPPDVAPTGATGEQPVATAFDQPPQVRNTAQVRQALEREYPIGLRATGTGGRVEIWFYVNDKGVVERSQLRRSSNNQDLDQAALRVAQVFQFNPGLRGNAPVAGWISVPIVFEGAGAGPDSPEPGSDPNVIFFEPS